MVWSAVDPNALDAILADVPDLIVSMSGPVDCMGLLVLMKYQKNNEYFIYRKRWHYIVLLILFMTLDLRLFQVLFRHC